MALLDLNSYRKRRVGTVGQIGKIGPTTDETS
jgi:hypothetical protein